MDPRRLVSPCDEMYATDSWQPSIEGRGAMGPKELEVGGGRWVERRGGLGYAFYERGVRGGVDGIVGRESWEVEKR
jgi:hypothetical protein